MDTEELLVDAENLIDAVWDAVGPRGPWVHDCSVEGTACYFCGAEYDPEALVDMDLHREDCAYVKLCDYCVDPNAVPVA